MIIKKEEILKVRLNKKSKEELKQKAISKGLSLSKYVRYQLLDNHLDI